MLLYRRKGGIYLVTTFDNIHYTVRSKFVRALADKVHCLQATKAIMDSNNPLPMFDRADLVEQLEAIINGLEVSLYTEVVVLAEDKKQYMREIFYSKKAPQPIILKDNCPETVDTFNAILYVLNYVLVQMEENLEKCKKEGYICYTVGLEESVINQYITQLIGQAIALHKMNTISQDKMSETNKRLINSNNRKF